MTSFIGAVRRLIFKATAFYRQPASSDASEPAAPSGPHIEIVRPRESKPYPRWRAIRPRRAQP